jgi:hypothetical protein
MRVILGSGHYVGGGVVASAVCVVVDGAGDTIRVLVHVKDCLDAAAVIVEFIILY